MASEQVERAKALAAEKVDQLTREAQATPRPSVTAVEAAADILALGKRLAWANGRYGNTCTEAKAGAACDNTACDMIAGGECWPTATMISRRAAEAVMAEEDSWAARRARARRLGLMCASPEDYKPCLVARCPAFWRGKCSIVQAVKTTEALNRTRGIPGQPDFDGDLEGR